MRGERVVLGVETEFGGFGLQRVVEPDQFVGAVTDTGPEHRDVLRRGEDTDATDFRLERTARDAFPGFLGWFRLLPTLVGVDGGGACELHVREPGIAVLSLRIRVDLAEELHRHVGLLGVGEAQPLRCLELGLQGGERLRQVVREVDSEEQSHSLREGASGAKRLGSGPERPSRAGGRVQLQHQQSKPRYAGSPCRATGRVTLTPDKRELPVMTDDPREDGSHEFSEGQGLPDDYEDFDLDPPELKVDPAKVDPVDSRVLSDLLDERDIPTEKVDAEELLDVGLSYTQINRFEEAATTFERAAKFADDGSLLQQEAWVNKGAAHSELEEYDEAIGAYKEAVKIDDESEHAATAETNLAYALWEFGRSEDALRHAENAVEIDPRFAQAWYNRGFFLLERGLAEKAVDCFDNAQRLGMRNPELLEEKVRALEEVGREEEAEEVRQRAEEIREEAEQAMVEEY